MERLEVMSRRDVPPRADVLMLPLLERSCFVCAHARFTPDGVTICSVVGESIDSERLAAADCETYEWTDDESDRYLDPETGRF